MPSISASGRGVCGSRSKVRIDNWTVVSAGDRIAASHRRIGVRKDRRYLQLADSARRLVPLKTSMRPLPAPIEKSPRTTASCRWRSIVCRRGRAPR